MQEMFQSREFRRYRKAILEEALAYISPLLWENNSHLPGALEMLRRIIKIPAKLTSDAEVRGLIERQVEEDLLEFQASYIRKHIE